MLILDIPQGFIFDELQDLIKDNENLNLRILENTGHFIGSPNQTIHSHGRILCMQIHFIRPYKRTF